MSTPGWWRPIPRRRRTPRPAAEYRQGVHVLHVPDVPADTLPPSVAITVPAPPDDDDLAPQLARVTAERDRLRDERDRAAGPPFPAWVNTGGCPCHHCTQDTP